MNRQQRRAEAAQRARRAVPAPDRLGFAQAEEFLRFPADARRALLRLNPDATLREHLEAYRRERDKAVNWVTTFEQICADYDAVLKERAA